MRKQRSLERERKEEGSRAQDSRKRPKAEKSFR